MRIINSRYRILGGFGLFIGLILATGFLSFFVGSKVLNENMNLTDIKLIGFLLFLFGLFLLMIFLFIDNCKFITIDNKDITFLNPILPFLKQTIKWTDFDYFILVDEQSRYDTYEAVWFIKDEKLKKRFSSFYYTNYDELKSQIPVKGHGKKYFGMFEQIFLLLRLKRIKIDK